MSRVHLPKGGKELVDALDAELNPAETEANVHLTAHKIIDAYLQGIRRFKVFDRFTGNMAAAFENAKGELELRYEEIVQIYLAEVGRYLKSDLSPIATKKGESLDALRKAGIANATLGALGAKLPRTKLQRRIIVPFLKYGTVGINHVETGKKGMPDLLEVVPPRQLRGFPAFVDGLENIYGIARKRWVPLEWAVTRMKELYKAKLPINDAESKLNARDIPWGTIPPEQQSEYGESATTGAIWSPRRNDVLGTAISKNGNEYYTDGNRKDGMGRMYVPLEEIYILDDSQEFVCRFIIKIGDTIVHDEDFEKAGLEVLCPLHVARHTDTGKFFARGFIAPLIPMNDQIEKMLANLFKNIAELDMFGTLFVPGGSGIDLKKWRTGKRPKVEKFEPDPLSPNMQPFNLTPFNAGMAPARIAEIAQGNMQRLSGQGPFLRGETSGRVDSAAGLGFLFNTGNIGLGLPANGLADAFAGVYSRMLQVAKDRMQPGDHIEMAVTDDSIAGVIINPQDGTLSLAENPIPNPWEVNIDVKDRTPRDRDVRKQELLDLHQRQLVDDTRFWVTAFQENLDFPGAPRELWETWRKAVWQIIMLFRDGKVPGTIQIGEHTQNPDIQLIALQEFMSKIEFSLAAPEVREAFEAWKVSLEVAAGKNFPAGLPSPEMVAQGVQPGQPTGISMAAGGEGGVMGVV